MPNSLAPAFFELEYHSAYGPHTQRVPTLDWNEDDTFDTWVSGSISSATMISGFVDLLLPFYPDTVVFDRYTVFTKEDATAPDVPRQAGVFTGKIGTADDAGWTKAVQLTMSLRSTSFGLVKYEFLDGASGDNYDPIQVPDSDMTALLAYVSDNDNGFSAQDNGKPLTFLQLTKTLNEKLRKAYRMA